MDSLYRAYCDDMRYLYNRHGDLYKKCDPSRTVKHRASDGLDRMIVEYAKETSSIRSYCGKLEFDNVLAEAKRFRRMPNKKALRDIERLENRK